MTHHTAFGLGLEELDIMIIEESRTAQNMLRSMLAGFGVKRIRSADNISDALQTMIAEPPNFLLTAWAVGGQSGKKLLEVMRHKRMEPLCYLPVVVVTAHATLKVVDEAFSAGCSSLLVKPISPAAMLQRIEWVLEDDRPFIGDGDSFAIAGMKQVLESRVRHRRVSSIIANNTIVDALMSGDINDVLNDLEDKAALDIDEASNSADADPKRTPAQERARSTDEKRLVPPASKPAPHKQPAEPDGKTYWYGWNIDEQEDDPSCQSDDRAA